MTEGLGHDRARLVRQMSVLLLIGAGIRIIAAVASGFVDWHDTTTPFAGFARARAYDVLTTFASAADGTGVLLAVAAAAGVWWAIQQGDVRAPALVPVVKWVLGVTALLSVMHGVGDALIYSLPPGRQIARLITNEGFALAYLVIAVGGVLLLGRVESEQLLADDELDTFVFAVDRSTGDVRAFLSIGDAVRGMHVYSIEDDEFAFYTDEGTVLEAEVVDGRIHLQPSDEVQADELLTRLRQFVLRRGITIDAEDADDPTAYALPISRWHWLELWPPWMRPIGMLLRRRG
jgi:hypothetical protein